MSRVAPHAMKTTIPAYPDEMIGAGLTLLRLAAASGLLDLASVHAKGHPATWLALIASALLITGAFTRWTASLTALALFGMGWLAPSDIAGAASLAVLLLTGPGAYSVDAVAAGRVHVRLRSASNIGI